MLYEMANSAAAIHSHARVTLLQFFPMVKVLNGGVGQKRK